MSEIDDRIEALKDTIARGHQELEALRRERAVAACPYTIGQIMVKGTSITAGQRVRITAINPDFGKGYRLRGTVLKKNGTDGKRETELYGFQMWEPEIA